MELYRLNDRIWYSEYETDRDRPALGYIRGDDFSVAIDAGHSDAHVNEFYDALKEHELPLPSLTVITHWHWDHSFGMHAIHGLSVANRKTNEYLKDFIAKRSEENDRKFLELDPSIALEYKDDRPIIVKEADIIFEDRLHLNAGNTRIELFQAPSSHTSDSTLILLPEEKVLFFGDALSGVFPTWIADPDLQKQFIDTIEALDVEKCIGGHWPVFTKEGLLYELYHYGE